MNILYQFNDKYAPYAGVSIVSLLANNSQATRIEFWILGEDLSYENVNRLEKTVSYYSTDGHFRCIHFVDSSDLIDKMKKLNIPTYRGSYSANIRLFVSEFIPNEVDKLLYLDADTVVVGDIEKMFNQFSNKYAIAMAYDSVGEGHKNDLGLESSEGYYNSGVILFNMHKWREYGYTELIIEHVKKVRAQYPSPDQDLLNIVVRGNIETLPPEYNYQPFHDAYTNFLYYRYYGQTEYYSDKEINYARDNVIIYHCFRFIGEFPWNKGNVHPFNDVFDGYLTISEWNKYVKVNDKLSIAIRIEKVMYRVLPRRLFLCFFKYAHGKFYSKANKQSRRGIINKKM